MGELRRRGNVWWIRYYRNGVRHEESTHSHKKQVARDILRSREGKIADGVPVSAAVGRYRFDDAVKHIEAEYAANQRRSLPELKRRVRLHLQPWFGGRRMVSIGSDDAAAFAKHRLDQGASPGEINRELAALKRMFSLALEANRLTHRPCIPMLVENNVRRGFVDDAQFAAIRDNLPAALRPVATFAYITGWRVQSEVLPLEWRSVDRKAGEVRLDAGTTKNRAGRVFPFNDELRRLFAALWTEHQSLRDGDTICPYVFQRSGKRIKSLRGAWSAACEAAGCPGRILHDLRRSAVRNMERRGLSRSVAMQLTGHKTESVYRRYAITSNADLQEAVRRLDQNMDLNATGTK
jgi:site-specific recombinase XerD